MRHTGASARRGSRAKRISDGITGGLAHWLTVVAVLAGAGLGTATAQTAADRVLQEVGFDQRLGDLVPLDLTFRDESGQPVRLSEYFGRRPVILALVYYECPMLCTLTLNGLASALKVLSFDVGKEFEVVTVSFNPQETPALAAAKKASYLQQYKRPGAAAGWHFLSGEESAIERLTQAVGFRYVYDPVQKEYAHATGIILLTPQGRIARYFFGVEFSPKDLRLGLIEASHNTIGTPVDQLLLYCFHYDPGTGKYSAVAMNIVRVAGVVTVLVLGTFMTVMFLRDRAKPQGCA